MPMAGVDDDECSVPMQKNAFDFSDAEAEKSILQLMSCDITLNNSDILSSFESQFEFSSKSSASPSSVIRIANDNKQIENYLNSLPLNKKKVNYHKFDPRDAINYMIKGDRISLEVYRGKEEKLNLLDYAIKCHDGNVITTVVLFLQKTLKPSIFNYELNLRPDAANHYVSHLRKNGNFNELIDVLTMLGKHEDAAMFRYIQAIKCTNIETKINNLKKCLQNHFTTGGSNVTFWNPLIMEQITLLELQLPIEIDDSRIERETQQNMTQQNLFIKIPRQTLLNMPVIDTLYYCCLYHYELSENNFASPKGIAKIFKLNQKQYLWTVLNALSKVQRWSDIDTLFEVRSLFGNKKIKSCIPFEKVLKVLHKNDAPEEMIRKYFNMIDDDETKFDFAKEFQMHNLAVDTLVKMREKRKLEEYIAKLPPESREFLYGNSALRAPSIRWKN